MSDAVETIGRLAQLCARKGLRLREARMMFHALYFGDVLAVAQGNQTKAAAIAGVTRPTIIRLGYASNWAATPPTDPARGEGT